MLFRPAPASTGPVIAVAGLPAHGIPIWAARTDLASG
jgi:hypothetical protein